MTVSRRRYWMWELSIYTKGAARGIVGRSKKTTKTWRLKAITISTWDNDGTSKSTHRIQLFVEELFEEFVGPWHRGKLVKQRGYRIGAKAISIEAWVILPVTSHYWAWDKWQNLPVWQLVDTVCGSTVLLKSIRQSHVTGVLEVTNFATLSRVTWSLDEYTFRHGRFKISNLLRNVMAPQSKQLATWYRKVHFSSVGNQLHSQGFLFQISQTSWFRQNSTEVQRWKMDFFLFKNRSAQINFSNDS
jgi:hypothetical protein